MGASKLGLLNRSNRGFASSVDVMGEPGAFELDDGGRAKSVDDVGNDGLVGVSAISSSKRHEPAREKVSINKTSC